MKLLFVHKKKKVINSQSWLAVDKRWMLLNFGEGNKGKMKCSFCGKTQEQVRKLVAGPGVYICDECVKLCDEIVEEEVNDNEPVELRELPKPREIYDVLNQYVIGQDEAKNLFL